jgi:hypothetical protein
MTKTWLAGVVAAALLVAGGLGGYFIGAANDNDRDRPGWHQQGGGPGDGFPGYGPGRGGDGPRWDRGGR